MKGKADTIGDRPWLVVGDFNEIIHRNEKWGQRDMIRSTQQLFSSHMVVCGLLDLGFVGLRYTWCNRRGLSKLVQTRKDRA